MLPAEPWRCGWSVSSNGGDVIVQVPAPLDTSTTFTARVFSSSSLPLLTESWDSGTHGDTTSFANARIDYNQISGIVPRTSDS